MLNNTKYKLTHGNALTAAFFGGSITDGTGASSSEKTSYRAIVSQWLKDNYPNAKINCHNCAIGGTGTSLGMYRCHDDVLSLSPDLIFMEFAVNDNGDTYQNVLRQTESIFRTIRGHNPFTDIITIITTGEFMIELLSTGAEYESRTAQCDASAHYGIPVIDAGGVLLAKILKDGGKLSDYIPDGSHPNDMGYSILAEFITNRISSLLADCDGNALVPHSTPCKMDSLSINTTSIIKAADLDQLELCGFNFVSGNIDSRCPQFLEATEQGAYFSFSFTGTQIALYWIGGVISNDVLVSIDGGEAFTARSWDHYVRSFHRLQAAHIAKGLNPGKHTVKITVAPGCSEPTVRIGGIMVGD